MSFQKVIAMGRLGEAPELKYMPSGGAACNFTMAVNERWTDKQGNRQERTEWLKVAVFGKQAENCSKYLGKGRMALIEGKLQTRSWEDKQGQKRYTTEIVASNVTFISGGSETSNPKDEEMVNAFNQAKKVFNDKSDFGADEIPF